MNKKKVDIILPIYYEEENIEKVILGIRKYVKTPCNIVLIYDKKNDPTINIAQVLQKKYHNLFLFKNKYGKGVVNALKTGFVVSKAQIILVMMADLSDNPKDIDKMIEKIYSGYDLVCASRYMKGGKKIGGPKTKGLLSKIACISLYYLFGLPTKDATNAFKCFTKKLIHSIKIESNGGFELPLEITLKAYIKGYKIAEIPTTWHERSSGNSKFKFFSWLPLYFRWYMFIFKWKLKDALFT